MCVVWMSGAWCVVCDIRMVHGVWSAMCSVWDVMCEQEFSNPAFSLAEHKILLIH